MGDGYGEREAKKHGWVTKEERDEFVDEIAGEAKAVLQKLKTKEGQRRLHSAQDILRTMNGGADGKRRLRQPKLRARAPIEPGDMQRFANSLHRGDKILYREGKAWSKPQTGIIKEKFTHIILLEGGVKDRTVMLFDILKCELGLIDDGWSYEK